MVERTLAGIFLLFLVACHGAEPVEAPQGTQAAPPPRAPGHRKAKLVEITFAIYTEKEGDVAAPLVEPHGLTGRVASSCALSPCSAVRELLATPDSLSVTMALTHDLPPPAFCFPAGGAGEADRTRLEKMPRVVMLVVRGEPGPPFVTLAAAHEVARTLGHELSGLVFDPDTLKLWRADDVPIVAPLAPPGADEQLSFGVLPVDDAYRIATFGGRRVGVPDLVAEGVPRERVGVAMAALSAVIRRMAMSGVPEGAFSISASDLAAAAPGTVALPAAAPGARGTADVELGLAARRDSDPDNELMTLTAPGIPAPSDVWTKIATDLVGASAPS
ncbi:MAG: hypothetical protein U0166_22410 [Acidobacteriota bacterium]